MVSSQDDKLYEILFENANDAQYILDFSRQIFIKVNRRFLELTGYTEKELLSGEIQARHLVLETDLEKFDYARSIRRDKRADRYPIRIRTKDGGVKDIEISVQIITYQGRELVLGAARDITERNLLEEKLRNEIDRQKKKTIEAAKASVRIYQLTEKIKNVPRLASELLHIDSLETLFEKAAALLTAKTEHGGMQYAGVVFLLIEGDNLEVKYSTVKQPLTKFNRFKNHKFAKASRGEEMSGLIQPGELVVPLRSKDQAIGVMQIFFDEDQRMLFEDSDIVRTGQEDIVRTLANTLGLLIDNIMLYHTVKQQAITDQLCNVYNRRFFDHKMKDEMKRAIRYKRDLSLIYIDVDNFKEINDTSGHPQGDVVLQHVANLLKKDCRDIDTICRLGGDEFIVILPETDLAHATMKTEQLRKLISVYEFPNINNLKEPLHVGLSFGIAARTHRVVNEEQLFRNADRALYKAKRSGRNMVCCYSDED